MFGLMKGKTATSANAQSYAMPLYDDLDQDQELKQMLKKNTKFKKSSSAISTSNKKGIDKQANASKNKPIGGGKPSKDMIIQNIGASYNPPVIVLEYRNGKDKKRYHHIMKLRKLSVDINSQQVLGYLKTKHKDYFRYGCIDEHQICKLVQKIKVRLQPQKIKKGKQIYQQEYIDQDYDLDYQQDLDD